jgi:hypothetical protein
MYRGVYGTIPGRRGNSLPISRQSTKHLFCSGTIRPSAIRQSSENRTQCFLCERYLGELKGCPILFSRDVIAWADKAEHICNLPYFVKFGLVFIFFRGQFAAKNFREILMSRPVSFLFGIEKTANFAQLAGIQPKAATARTFIDLNFLFDAEEVFVTWWRCLTSITDRLEPDSMAAANL